MRSRSRTTTRGTGSARRCLDYWPTARALREYDGFTALMLASNREMLELIEELGPARTIEQAAGTVELEITLPPHGTGPHLGDAAARLG